VFADDPDPEVPCVALSWETRGRPNLAAAAAPSSLLPTAPPLEQATGVPRGSQGWWRRGPFPSTMSFPLRMTKSTSSAGAWCRRCQAMDPSLPRPDLRSLWPDPASTAVGDGARMRRRARGRWRQRVGAWTVEVAMARSDGIRHWPPVFGGHAVA
jgi:hypothetical protein